MLDALHRLLGGAILALVAVPLAPAQDWTNSGGNGARNGLAPGVLGPADADVLWTNTDDFSLIAWHPVVHDGRVFAVREAGFPQTGGPANDAVVAYDLDTGAELWRTTLPYGGDPAVEWIAWIGGARDGRVYASRSSNGQPAPVRALDAATGAAVWTSAATTEAFAYDGVVFAPDGDLIVGDFSSLTRVEATDGSTVWSVPRPCPVSGNCGAAVTDTAAYIDEQVVGGQVVTRVDLATGAMLYSSPTMPGGFIAQNAPFVSPDGQTVYFARTQNNASVDFLYAFRDTGTALVQLWSRAVRWTTSHEHGVGPDGTIYAISPADELMRLDPATGNVLGSTAPLSPFGSPNASPKTAVDALGNVYLSNGWGSTPATNGRLWAFDASLSTTRFTLNLDRQNNGGPALARDGTLVVADRVGVHAFRTPAATTYCTGKTSSLGCVPFLATAGTPSASSTAPFSVQALDALPGEAGVLLYSARKANLSFHGGKLCVKAPFTRVLPPKFAKSTGQPPCSGVLSRNFNNVVQGGGDPGLTVGATVFAQWRQRDPGDPAGFGDSLTDAVRFVVAP